MLYKSEIADHHPESIEVELGCVFCGRNYLKHKNKTRNKRHIISKIKNLRSNLILLEKF